MAKKLGLLVASSALCLVVLEVAFRLLGYRPIYDVYSKPEAFWRRDPLLGWSLQPGSRGVFVGPRPFPIEFRAHVRVNSLGLRGPEPEDVPPGGYRVLVLGDSQTAGFEVPEDRTYPAVLERELGQRSGRRAQVVNAGVRGYGTDQELLLYRRLRTRLRADVVVVHETANDPEDNTTLHRMRRPFGKAAFAVDSDGGLREVGRPIPAYPLCSAYRVDARFRKVRVDSARARAFCWFETRLSDHSALFSFMTSRIERNPRLLKALYGLGSPSGEPQPAPATPTGPRRPRPLPRRRPPGPPRPPPPRPPRPHPAPTTPIGSRPRSSSPWPRRSNGTEAGSSSSPTTPSSASWTPLPLPPRESRWCAPKTPTPATPTPCSRTTAT